MPRKKHDAHAVMTYFRTQSKEVCDLTLAIIKDEMTMRFKGLTIPSVGLTKKTRKPKQMELPFDEKFTAVKEPAKD